MFILFYFFNISSNPPFLLTSLHRCRNLRSTRSQLRPIGQQPSPTDNLSEPHQIPQSQARQNLRRKPRNPQSPREHQPSSLHHGTKPTRLQHLLQPNTLRPMGPIQRRTLLPQNPDPLPPRRQRTHQLHGERHVAPHRARDAQDQTLPKDLRVTESEGGHILCHGRAGIVVSSLKRHFQKRHCVECHEAHAAVLRPDQLVFLLGRVPVFRVVLGSCQH